MYVFKWCSTLPSSSNVRPSTLTSCFVWRSMWRRKKEGPGSQTQSKIVEEQTTGQLTSRGTYTSKIWNIRWWTRSTKITQFKSIWYLNNVNYYICWNFRMSSHVTVKRLPAPPDNSSGKFWEFFDKQSLDSFPHKDFGKPRFSFKKRAGAWFQ